jgi:nicotinate-nucleotide adenylyltransferase
MDRRRRIALYGGTFDPVHLGHLEVARKVSQIFDIDEVLFVPAQVAPHKVLSQVTPALHRYAMLALATQEEPQLRVSTFELEAPGRSYTVDTLSHFKSELHDSADLFFLMGADSWQEITTWHEWERLLTMASHIIVGRPGYELEAEGVTPGIAERIIDLRGADEASALQIVRQTKASSIFFTDAVMVDVSATEIRRAALEDRSEELRRLVPSSVASYIRKYSLYEDLNEA